MRWLLVLALLGLAYASSWESTKPSITLREYKPNGEYTYAIESQLLTGVPSSSNVFSGTRCSAIMKLQFTSRSEGIMKIVRVKFIGGLNRYVAANPKLALPVSAFEEISLSGDDLELIKKPVKFSYVDGHIRSVKVTPSEGPSSSSGVISEEDMPWTLNLKLTLLQLLQVRWTGEPLSETNIYDALRSRTVHDSEQRSWVEKHYDFLRRRPSGSFLSSGSGISSSSPVYSVMEDSTSGQCEVLYHRVSSPVCPSGIECLPVTNFTKVRNYTNCVNDVLNFKTSIWAGEKRFDKKIVERATESRLGVIGSSSSSFMIDWVDLGSEYSVTPFEKKGGAMVAYVNKTISLIGSKSITEFISASECTIETYSERYHTVLSLRHFPRCPWCNRWKDESSSSPSVSRLRSKVYSLLSAIRSRLTSSPAFGYFHSTKSTSDLVTELYYLISHRPSSIWRKAIFDFDKRISDISPEIRSKMHSILVKLVPDLPYSSGHRGVSELLDAEELPGVGEDTSDIWYKTLKGLTYSYRPNSASAHQVKRIFERFCLNGESGSKIRRVGCLAAGHLINMACRSSRLGHYPGSGTACGEFGPMIELFRTVISGSSEGDKILLIKSVGNMGIRENLDLLKEIFTVPTYSTKLRVEAIKALSKLTVSSGPVVYGVKRTLLPLVLSESENTEVRIEAFKMLMKCRPHVPFSILDMIVKIADKETSMQFGSYVYSYLKSIAWNGYVSPSLSNIAQRALSRFSKPFRPGMQYSKHLSVGGMLDRESGGMVSVDMISTPESPIPRSLSLKLKTLLFGYDVDVFEFGVRQEGLLKLLEEFFGPAGSYYNKESILDLFSRGGSGSGSGSSTLRDSLGESLGINTREPEGRLKLSTYYKWFEREIDYMTASGRSVVDSISGYGFSMNKPFNVVKPSVFTDSFLTIPTELGFPLVVSLTGSSVSQMSGSFESSTSVEGGKGLSVRFSLNPRIETSLESSLKVVMHGSVVGVSIRGRADVNVPVKVKVSTSLGGSKSIYVAEMDYPESSKTLLNLEMTPLTFFKTKYSVNVPEVRIIHGRDVCHVSEFFTVLPTPVMSFKVRGASPKLCTYTAPYFPFTGMSNLTVRVESATSSSSKLRGVMTWEKKYGVKIDEVSIPEEVVTGYTPSTEFGPWPTTYGPYSEESTTPRRGYVPESEYHSTYGHVPESSAYSPYTYSYSSLYKPVDYLSMYLRPWLSSYYYGSGSSSSGSGSSSSEESYEGGSGGSSSWYSSWLRTPYTGRLSSWYYPYSFFGTPSYWKGSRSSLYSDSYLSTSHLSGMSPEALWSKYREDIDTSTSPVPTSYSDWLFYWRSPALRSRIGTSATKSIVTYEITSGGSKILSGSGIYVKSPVVSYMKVESLMDTTGHGFKLTGFLRSPFPYKSWSKRLPVALQKTHGYFTLEPVYSGYTSGSKKIIIRTLLDKSVYQRFVERIPLMPEYRQCLHDRETVGPYSTSCLKVMRKASELRRLSVTVKAPFISELLSSIESGSGSGSYGSYGSYGRYYSLSLLDSLLYYSYGSNYWSVPSSYSSFGKVLMVFNLRPCNRQIDVEVHSSGSSRYLKALTLPMKIIPASYRTSWTKLIKRSLTGNMYPAYCKLTDRDYIRTFDNATLKVRGLLSSDPVLLSKDCSRTRYYSLMTKKEGSTSKTLLLELLMPSTGTVKTVKITPGSSSSSSVPEVSIDGSPVSLSEKEEYIIFDSAGSGSTKSLPPVLVVRRYEPYVVEVKSPKLGVTVLSDGHNVQLLLSHYYQSKTCGLCGDFDTEKYPEWYKPSGSVARSTGEFVSSYTLGGGSGGSRRYSGGGI